MSSTPTLHGGYWTFPHRALSRFSEDSCTQGLPVPLWKWLHLCTRTQLLWDGLWMRERGWTGSFGKRGLFRVPSLCQSQS